MPFDHPMHAMPPAGWPQPEALGFGQHLGPLLVCSDHDGQVWSAPRIVRAPRHCRRFC